MRLSVCAVILFSAFGRLWCPAAFAEDTGKGARAVYEAGDYERAFTMALPLAEHGDVDAQMLVAGMYALGDGVPRAAAPECLLGEQHLRTMAILGILWQAPGMVTRLYPSRTGLMVIGSHPARNSEEGCAMPKCKLGAARQSDVLRSHGAWTHAGLITQTTQRGEDLSADAA